VGDTGTGIPKEIREKVFEPFFSTKKEGRGTGLGLSICLGLVRSHGGEIELESEVGKGSRFIIKFPVESSESKDLQHG
jgi:signal transduction histidine kinase